MKLDMTFHKGAEGMPSVIFIHGLGMDKDIWANPSESRLLGGLLPLGVIYKKKKLKTLFHDFRAKGYTVIAWSQRRPVQKVESALEELRYIIEMELPPFILIGHSRGGLVARLAASAPGVRAVITLSAPHLGSNMAKWAQYLSPLASIINPLFPESKKGTIAAAVKKMLDFLESEGVRELLPGSELLKSLPSEFSGRPHCISAGGTEPGLFKIGRVSFPEVLLKLLPKKARYEELIRGKGDGLVSARSARCPASEEHLDFPQNHLNMLFDPDVRKAMVEKITGIRLN